MSCGVSGRTTVSAICWCARTPLLPAQLHPRSSDTSSPMVGADMPATSAPLAVIASSGSSYVVTGSPSVLSHRNDHVAPLSVDGSSANVVRAITTSGFDGEKTIWFDAGKRPLAAAGV